MQKILVISAIFLFCGVLLTGCKPTSNNAAPKMQSHTSRTQELQKEYAARQAENKISDTEYSYEDNQLKINLR